MILIISIKIMIFMTIYHLLYISFGKGFEFPNINDDFNHFFTVLCKANTQIGKFYNPVLKQNSSFIDTYLLKQKYGPKGCIIN